MFTLLSVILCAVLVLGARPEPRPLHVKSFPAIEDIQSALHEVYMEPYPIDLKTIAAVAVVEGEGENAVSGEVIFVQRHPPNGPVLVTGNITGLPTGRHAIHIHRSGDLRQGCEKLGTHFNPFLLQHGSPQDPLRHIGDLGNIEANEDGIAQFKFVDPVLSLIGNGRSVVGRALVITEDEDDFGRGANADSVEYGNSGRALACGVIAYIK